MTTLSFLVVCRLVGLLNYSVKTGNHSLLKVLKHGPGAFDMRSLIKRTVLNSTALIAANLNSWKLYVATVAQWLVHLRLYIWEQGQLFSILWLCLPVICKRLSAKYVDKCLVTRLKEEMMSFSCTDYHVLRHFTGKVFRKDDCGHTSGTISSVA